MNVALFIKSLSGGGAQRSLVSLAGGIAERGHAVELILSRAQGPLLAEVAEAVRVVDLRTRSALSWLAALARDPRGGLPLLRSFLSPDAPLVLGSVPALADHLRRTRPDALLAAGSWANVAAIEAARLAGVGTRVVVSERNTLSVRAARDGPRYRRLPEIVRRAYPKAAAIVAVSEGVADDLARVTGLPRERIRTTYNPVLTPELDRLAALPVEHPWFQPGEPPVVLGAGRLHPQKDFPTLLRAFADLQRSDARLVILGEGAEREALLALARELGVAERFGLPGFVTNPFAYMAKAAVFALSSAWEGLPGVLIQAMACGCPVVSTDCPSGAAEVLEGGIHGPLVPVGDARALARAIDATLAAPPDLGKLRTRAEDFSLPRVVDRHLEVLFG